MESMTIHTFVDASQEAYGAVVYALAVYKSGQISVRLIASKTKVAPLLATIIPRLEVMTAVLGLRLTVSVVKVLNIDIKSVILWSDSINLLWWIRRQIRKWYPGIYGSTSVEVCPNKAEPKDPRIDEEGLLRCGGRLSNADYLSYDTQHPIILAKKCWVTKLIVKTFHERRNHVSGTNQILADLATRYWLVAAREEIRDWEKECSWSRRQKSDVATQIMAPLPSVRVKQPLRAFSRVAVDFAGPFLTKQGRGRVQRKKYLCLFTCLLSRAVHFEVAYGMDTDSFLNAFNRMINRRGVPLEIICRQRASWIGWPNGQEQNSQVHY